MVLKDCVDAHPEYYGKMSQPKEAPKESATATDTPDEEVVNEEEVNEEVTLIDLPQEKEEDILQVSEETSTN